MDGTEPDEDGRLLGGIGKELGFGQLGDGGMQPEGPVGGDSSGVDDSLGDTLVVKFGNLLSCVEIVQDRRASFPSLDAPRGFLNKEEITSTGVSADQVGRNEGELATTHVHLRTPVGGERLVRRVLDDIRIELTSLGVSDRSGGHD